jgi:hypothetical protein
VSPQFESRLAGDQFTAGDTVRGTVVVTSGGKSRSLQVSLEFHEDTDDYGSVAAAISSGPLHTGDLEAGMAFPFELTLPPDALPNYRSAHGDLYWEVHVRSDEFGLDSHARRRITVVPQRVSRTPG